MRKAIFTISALCFLAFGANAQTKSETIKNDKTMTTENKSTESVKAFFNAFGKGDFDGIINSFHDECLIIAIRDGVRTDKQIYGTYKEKEGAKAFISNLGNAFDTKAFSVDNIIGEGNIAFANGKFTHIVKSTGKSFTSDWSLMCIIKDGKILEYHFYEDSAKFVEANN